MVVALWKFAVCPGSYVEEPNVGFFCSIYEAYCMLLTKITHTVSKCIAECTLYIKVH